MKLFKGIIIAVIALILVSLLWRFYSKRHTLPCPAWLAWLIELDNPFAPAHKSAAIIEFLALRKGMKILDIGCGPGRVLLPLAQKAASLNGVVTGLDIQKEMLDKVKNRAKKAGIKNIEFKMGAVGKVQLPQNYYDAVLMVSMLGEVPENEHAAVLRKVAASLKSDGIISISETIFDPHYQQQNKIINLMRQVGLVQTKSMGNWLAYTAHFIKK